MRKISLDKQEAALEKEAEQGEWVEVPDMADALHALRTDAHKALHKNRKINIRLSDWDYENIKLRAAREGLPYQTLVSSVIHRFLTGTLTPTP